MSVLLRRRLSACCHSNSDSSSSGTDADSKSNSDSNSGSAGADSKPNSDGNSGGSCACGYCRGQSSAGLESVPVRSGCELGLRAAAELFEDSPS